MTKPRLEWSRASGRVPYPEALAHMEARVDGIIYGRQSEEIWLLEHPPLYTGGTSADPSELKDATRFPVYSTGRGGRYTYHGPGQRVIYAMIDLRARGKDLRAHVFRLEEWVIQTLADLHVKAERRDGRIGLWVVTPQGDEKIAALGVRIRKWVTYHGLALNIDPDLTHFEGIVPCGLAEFGVTSLRKLGLHTSMSEVDDIFRRRLDVLIPEF